MSTVYNLCKLLIDRGRTEGLQEKMDVYLAADRLTPEKEFGGLALPTFSACQLPWVHRIRASISFFAIIP